MKKDRIEKITIDGQANSLDDKRGQEHIHRMNVNICRILSNRNRSTYMRVQSQRMANGWMDGWMDSVSYHNGISLSRIYKKSYGALFV